MKVCGFLLFGFVDELAAELWELGETRSAFCGEFSKRGGNGGKIVLGFFHGFHRASVSTAGSLLLGFQPRGLTENEKDGGVSLSKTTR